ncbi:hypothetical protein [Leifsonia aquatica]|uniref:hypothetical protein n=1 Tax=Leifsonia aquatica TaxID=144185 RepID=UPI00381F2F78
MTEASKRESLADAFRPMKSSGREKPNRAEGLSAMLGDRRPPTSAEDATVVPLEDNAGPEVAQRQKLATAESPRGKTERVSRSSAKNTTPRSAESSGGVGTRAVYVPAGVLAELKARKRASDVTYAELLVLAFDNVSDEELVSAFVREPVRSKSGMPTIAPASRGSEGVQVNLRLSSAQVEWLDAKEAQVGAPSRSALVAKVWAIYLGL